MLHTLTGKAVIAIDGNIVITRYLLLVRRFLLIVALLLLSITSSAVIAKPDSLATVIGVVQQEHINTKIFVPLNGCIIQVFFEKGGKLDSLYTTSTAPNGRFTFKNMTPQRILMRLQCLGYETQSGIYDIGPGDNAFSFTMKDAVEELSAASVAAELQLMKQIKDTTIFNTQAIRSLPGEDLTDVLSQIPGFSVTENSVSFDGVIVAKTYVNGVLVFGDNTMNAITALKADEVTQVKVYDEQSAIDMHRGKINSRKEKVLNVITRKNFVSLSRAAGAVAGGCDNSVHGRYGAVVGANYDSESLNLEAGFLANNYNTAESTISGAKGIQYHIESPEQHLNSYFRKEGIVLSMEKHWRNRYYGNSMFVSYSYNHNYNSDESTTRTDYFKQSGQDPQASIDSIFSKSSNHRHSVTSKFCLLDTPFKSFTIDMAANINHGCTDTRNRDIWTTDNLVTKERSETSGDKNLSYSLDGTVNWTNNDIVNWRPRVELWGKFSKSGMDSWSVDTLASSFLNKQLTGEGTGLSISNGLTAGVSNNLINDKKRSLDLDMYGSIAYSRSKNRNLAVDEWQVVIPVINIANSYEYTYNDVLSRAVAAISYSNQKKLNIDAGLSLNNKIMLNNELIPIEYSERKSYIYPSYNLEVSWPKFTITSFSQEITPSIEQVRNRVSDKNPLVLTAGNPDLKQAHLFSIAAQYKSGALRGKNSKTHSIQGSLKGKIILFPLINQSHVFTQDSTLDKWDGYIAKAGSMLYTWENAAHPSWDLGINVDYNTRILKNKASIRINLESSYSKNPIYMGSELLWTGHLHKTAGVSLNYNPSSRIKILNNNKISYILSIDNDFNTLVSRVELSERIRIIWFILPRLRWENTYNLLLYKSIQGLGMDNSNHVLNTRLSVALLKDASLEIAISGNDLLNSSQSYLTQTNALYMTQEWKNTYGRYGLLTVTYNFRKKK